MVDDFESDEFHINSCLLLYNATALLYHVCAVASRNIRFASCGTSGKLTLWTRYVCSTDVLQKHAVSILRVQVCSFRNSLYFIRKLQEGGHETGEG
jgi:hypothetical protein